MTQSKKPARKSGASKVKDLKRKSISARASSNVKGGVRRKGVNDDSV